MVKFSGGKSKIGRDGEEGGGTSAGEASESREHMSDSLPPMSGDRGHREGEPQDPLSAGTVEELSVVHSEVSCSSEGDDHGDGGGDDDDDYDDEWEANLKSTTTWRGGGISFPDLRCGPLSFNVYVLISGPSKIHSGHG